MKRNIVTIGNYYGCLQIKMDDDGFGYWGIGDWSGMNWEIIPDDLFDALNRYADKIEGEEE